MSSKFVTLALLGGLCAASAPFQSAIEENFSHYTAHTMAPAYEHPRLAHYLETDRSNALDKTAAEMLGKNAEYAEDLLDHHSPDLPTFHVVHEPDHEENEANLTPTS